MIQMGVHDARQPSETTGRVDMSHAAIRAWARVRGIPVAAHGLIPKKVRKLYVEAMEQARTSGGAS